MGYHFSPRLADIGEARFWRLDPQADYGALDGLARQRINADLLATHWEELLRVAGALHLGTVSASALLRALQAGGRPTGLARASGELGRMPKTLHLRTFIDDEPYRRRILTQRNRGEGRHGLARAVFHGQKGALRQRYREGQEDRRGALGLVVNALVLWTTRYTALAPAHPRQAGTAIRDEDVARLSPRAFEHINLHGCHTFALAEPLTRGTLRALRDPTTAEALEG